MSLDDLFSQIQEGNLKELNLIVKADVQGSVEAVKQSLTKLSNEEIVVKCIHGGVGAINESDVLWQVLPTQSSSASTFVPMRQPRRPQRERGRCTSVQGYLPGYRRRGSCHEGYAGSRIRRRRSSAMLRYVRSSRHLQSAISQVLMFWTAYLPEAVRCVLPEKVS